MEVVTHSVALNAHHLCPGCKKEKNTCGGIVEG